MTVTSLNSTAWRKFNLSFFLTSMISIAEKAKLLIIDNACELKLSYVSLKVINVGLTFSKDMNLPTSGLEIW